MIRFARGQTELAPNTAPPDRSPLWAPSVRPTLAMECPTVTKFAVIACLTAAVVASLVYAPPITAQTGAAGPGKVGLIDMAYVFSEYDKFEALQADLKNEAKQIDESFKAKMKQMEQVQKQLASGQFAAGSPEAKKLESDLITMQTDFQAKKKVQQRDFMRRESEIYKTIYVEVQDTVRMYSEARGYDVILRFSRNSVDEASNPQAILQSMNRQVVHFDPTGDITENILAYLNKKFATGK